MNRLFIILSTLLALLSSCTGKQQGDAVSPPREGFDITGVWMLVDLTHSGKNVSDFYLSNNRLPCKLYESDSTFYNFHLSNVYGMTLINPRESGVYSLRDTLYVEDGHVTPIRFVDDSTMITLWEGFEETWRRSATITASRIEEIRAIIHSVPEEKRDELGSFVLSTSERELKHTISVYHYLLGVLTLAVLLVIVYAIELAKRKRRVEENLRAVKEELQQRPMLVTEAIKQVESDFFQSDYYQALRLRIATGTNMSEEDWREIERRVNAVSSGFTRKLRSLYDFSDVEYQVCLLIKLRIPHKDIAAVTHRAPDSVSSIRSRLHKKILGPNGGAKEWDYFILSL